MDNQTLSANVLLASGTEKEIQKQLDRIKNLSVEIQHASLNPNVIKNLQKQLSGQALSVKVDVDASGIAKAQKTGSDAVKKYTETFSSLFSKKNTGDNLKSGLNSFIGKLDRFV